MKQAAAIIIAMLLALTMAHLGAGTVVVECLHSNTVTVGVPEDECCQPEKNCHSKEPCKRATVLKLQPMTQCKRLSLNQVPVMALLPLLSGFAETVLPMANDGVSYVSAACQPHAPPRHYLAMISVLVI